MIDEYYEVKVMPYQKSPWTKGIDGWSVTADGYYGLEYSYKKEAMKKARKIAKKNKPAKLINRNRHGEVIGETKYD